MRFFILTAALCLTTWSIPEFRAWSTTLFEDGEDPHIVAAIELRCASKESAAFRAQCARELERDFERGVRLPEAIVRLHCSRFSSDWAPTSNSPDPICKELYGGWIEG
jgi:hypothetical protein